MSSFFKSITFIVISFFTIVNKALSQRQSDIIVDGNSFFSIPWEAPGQNFLMVFNEDSLEFIDNETPINISGITSRSAYADKYGNLKFASNGWRLVNGFGEVLSYKLWSPNMPRPNDSYDTTMVLISKGPLFLEAPGDSSKVYLFYGEYKAVTPNPPSIFSSINYDFNFSYALLDVATQSLISQNNTVLTDTTSLSDAVAVRHGNGRDWWIIKPGIFTNEYYISLLDPSGLSNMVRIVIPGLIPHEQTNTVSHFTQDGNKFIHFTGLGSKWVQRFDFDRCAGTLSNPIETDLNPIFRPLDPCNFTISPDGSKFYAVRLNYNNDPTYQAGIYQYDFNTDTLSLYIQRTGLSFLTPNFKEILFFTRLVPNTTTDLYYSSINNPNGLGVACEVEMFKYEVLNLPYNLYSPNIVNYRLGPLVGSACDPLSNNSLGLQQQMKIGMDVYPNPNQGLLNIRLNNSKNKVTTLQIFNSSGQKVMQDQLISNSKQIDLRSLTLPSGVYWVEVLCKEQLLRQKFVYCGL